MIVFGNNHPCFYYEYDGILHEDPEEFFIFYDIDRKKE